MYAQGKEELRRCVRGGDKECGLQELAARGVHGQANEGNQGE